MTSLLDAYPDYLEAAKNDFPVINEATFKTDVLPALLKKNRGERADFERWHRITGVAHRQISVVDDQGVELFRVPPILSRLPTALDQDARISVAGLADLYYKRRSVENPIAVDLWFNQQVDGMSPSIHDEDMLGYLRNNMLIYKRYNLPIEDLLGAAAGTIEPKALDGSSTPATEREVRRERVADADEYDFDGEGSDL